MDTETDVVLWIHGDCLRPNNPAFNGYPMAPAVFVFDDDLLEEYCVTLKRIVFLYECLLELPVTLRRGEVGSEVLAFAHEHSASRVVTVESPAPRFDTICEQIRRALPVEILDDEPFLEFDGRLDLKRFSRYWQVARQHVFGDTR